MDGGSECEWTGLIHVEQAVTIGSSTSTPTSSLNPKQVIEELCDKRPMKRLTPLVSCLSPHVKSPLYVTSTIFHAVRGRVGSWVYEEGQDSLSLCACISQNFYVWIRQKPLQCCFDVHVLHLFDNIVTDVFFHPESQSCFDLLNNWRSSGVFPFFYFIHV